MQKLRCYGNIVKVFYYQNVYKILRFQIVALPRLESWDVMIVVLKSAQVETEWRSILFLKSVKEAKDVLEGAVFILLENIFWKYWKGRF